MGDCLHMFRGYRVPVEAVEAVRQAIIDTPRRVDVGALRAIVEPALLPVDPWFSTSRGVAARCAVDSLLFDAVRAGLIRRRVNAWHLPAWWRVRKQAGAA
ncbi:hypothetical protein LMG26858_04412 [Achromobacter anxifer]|uniref:Uncharacterized protein n=1 Tax=Achromobacter anxifer TaxID=1287737 RepID=A0A6S7EB75_9BURK|nr:hypothetical protein [Achromobacter anxifer]CAB3904558.1 hypothetical protein LMG26858_04412 [Achromobacter anxifer]CAB5512034.1 hypothetical protein LMG26857_01323 [Achromobacter anxifer]